MSRALHSGLISILLIFTALPGSASPVSAQVSSPVYLIIAPDEFELALAPFIELKTSQGYQTDLALLSETGASNEQIKNFIQAYSPRPKYVLLAGDTDHIPTWAVTTVDPALPGPCQIASTELKDLYYTTLDGECDTIPNLILGRFPVHNAAQLTALIDKYQAFDSAPPDVYWRDKLSFIASDAETFSGYAEKTHNEVIAQFTSPRGFSGAFTRTGAPTAGGDRLYALTYHAGEQDLLNALDQGRLVVTYFGPGSATQWLWKRDQVLTTSDVAGLTGPPVPLILGLSQGTADYRVDTSLGDAFLLHPTGGALAYIGGSFDTSNYAEEFLEILLWQALLTDPAAKTSIGEALHAALTEFPDLFPNSAIPQDFWETYQILGDPSLRVIPCKCGRLASPYDTYAGRMGEVLQIPLTLTNYDILPGNYLLSISAPARFNAHFPSTQVVVGPGKTIDLDVFVEIPWDFDQLSGDIEITATLGSLNSRLVLNIRTVVEKIYLPMIQTSPPAP